MTYHVFFSTSMQRCEHNTVKLIVNNFKLINCFIDDMNKCPRHRRRFRINTEIKIEVVLFVFFAFVFLKVCAHHRTVSCRSFHSYPYQLAYNKLFANRVTRSVQGNYESLTFTHGPRKLGRTKKVLASYFLVQTE